MVFLTGEGFVALHHLAPLQGGQCFAPPLPRDFIIPGEFREVPCDVQHLRVLRPHPCGLLSPL